MFSSSEDTTISVRGDCVRRLDDVGGRDALRPARDSACETKVVMLANASIQKATRRCRTSGEGSTFTAKYGVKMLVWYAIAREKRSKRWEREWKARADEHSNRASADLYERLNA